MRIRRLTLTVLVTLGVSSGAGLLWSAAALAAPETPVTEAATAITGTTAILNGEPNPNTRATVGYEFDFNSNGSCEGNTVGGVVPAELFAGTKVGAPVTGLEGSTEYTFCIVAFNEAGETATGPALKFKTPTIAPVIAAESVSAVTPFDSVLEGQLNTEKQETSYHYEYSSEKIKVEKGQGTPFGEGSLPGTSGVQGVNPADIGGGLTPNTTYYYRVVATNATGTDNGTIEHFTTSTPEKPVVNDEPAAGVGQGSASLSGQVNPEFQPLSICEFQFVSEAVFNATGFTTSPGSASCAPSAGELGEGGGSVGVAADLSGLEANTTYYYRLLAKNATGTGESAAQSFLTLPSPPTVLTGEASEVGANSATIAGSVDPGSVGVNSDTTYYFQYSTDTSYDTQIPLAPADVGQGTTSVRETAALTGLEPNSTYHYRLVASNDNANTTGGSPQLVYGQGATFRTPATPPLLGPASASAITQSSATVEAMLDARGLPTHWELRLADTQGSLDPQVTGNTTGSTSEALALNVASLTPGTVYYYELIVVNPDGTVESTEGSFTTLPAPAPANVNLFTAAPLLSIPANVFPVEEAGTTGKEITTRGLNRAQKLENALKVCARDKAHKKSGAGRVVCEAKARKRYGPVKRKKKKKR